MTTYRETQYFNPVFYVVVGAIALSASALPLASGQTITALCIVLSCLFAMLLLGRMVIQLDENVLTIRFGWVGVIRRSLDVSRVDSARVCMFNPIRTYFGWGWRIGLDGSVCYSMRGRRGVEIILDGRRHVVGSQNPRELSAAIRGEVPEPLVDERPAVTPMPYPPRPRAGWAWSLMVPRDWTGHRELV